MGRLFSTCFKDGTHPAARQSTPLGLGRLTLLVIYMCYVFMAGCIYMGWSPLSSMFLKSGVMSEFCPHDENGKIINDLREQGYDFACNEQEAAVQKIYTLTFAVHCTFSSVAGLSIDFLGPRLTALLGLLSGFIGWLLVGLAGTKSTAAFIAGFVFIGMGIDPALLPHLCITRLFPGSSGLIITITGSVSSAAMYIPSIMYAFDDGSLSACIYYACLGPGLMAVVALLCFPAKNFVFFPPNINILDQQGTGITADIQMEEGTMRKSQVAEGTVETIELSDASSSKCALTTFKENDEDSTVESHVKPFFTQLLSERYILVVIYFIGTVCCSAFYQQAPRRMFEESIVKFFNYFLPLSFIPCIFLGKIADVFGIVRTMLLLNTFGLLTYICSMIRQAVFGYLSVIFFTLYMSLFIGQIFVYVEVTFSPNNFGKLIGIACTIGGILSLVCNPLYELAVQKGIEGLFIIQSSLIGLLCLHFIILGRLYYLYNKSPHPYW